MTGQFETALGALYRVSVLLLPLSDNGTDVNMLIFSRVACFASDVRASRDWLAGAPFKIEEAVDIDDEGDLMGRCFHWESSCLPAAEALH
jgi:hypothetical protein